MKYLILILVIFSLCITSSGSAVSQTVNNSNSNSSAAASLEKMLLATESLVGNFTQTTQDSSGNILQESSGKFKLATPGLFYWEVMQPYENKIIVRNKQVIMLDPELEQATIRSLDNSGDQFLVSLLTGADSTGAITALNNFEITQKNQQYNLISETENSLVSSITLSFSAQGPISQIKFVNALDQTTIIDFTHLTANKKLDLAIFNQAIPEDYDSVLSEE